MGPLLCILRCHARFPVFKFFKLTNIEKLVEVNRRAIKQSNSDLAVTLPELTQSTDLSPETLESKAQSRMRQGKLLGAKFKEALTFKEVQV